LPNGTVSAPDHAAFRRRAGSRRGKHVLSCCVTCHLPALCLRSCWPPGPPPNPAAAAADPRSGVFSSQPIGREDVVWFGGGGHPQLQPPGTHRHPCRRRKCLTRSGGGVVAGGRGRARARRHAEDHVRRPGLNIIP
jgi:hypothetical protein